MNLDPKAIHWRAESDGIAHAHVRRLPRTVCDRPATPERHAWPRQSYCVACIASLEAQEVMPFRPCR